VLISLQININKRVKSYSPLRREPIANALKLLTDKIA
jgi:hypothetical protein